MKFSILSVLAIRQDTRKFPVSTAVPVLTFPSLHRIKVSNVANNDVEDSNAKNSNFKTMSRDKTKTHALLNIAEQCRTESAIRPATSLGDLRWLIEKSLFTQFYFNRIEQEKCWSSGRKHKYFPEFLSELFDKYDLGTFCQKRNFRFLKILN